MIDFRMATFLKLCEVKNYTKTAKEINITQPAVTQHIQSLEKEFNIKVFIKEGKNIFLTREGELLKALAEKIYAEEKKLKQAFLEPSTFKINFGATLTIGDNIMPKKIEKYLKKNPLCEISMRVENTDSLLHMLNEGSIEVALVEGNYQKNQYTSLLISKEKFIAVAGMGLKINNNCKLEELCKYPIIVRERGSGTRSILENYIKENNLVLEDFERIIELGNFNSIKHLVINNLGITFVYKPVVQEELDKGILKEIKIMDFNLFHEFNFVYLKDSLLKEKYLEFYQFLKK
ncbi:MAG: LysR family transcriptional regulator [Clostridiales bacterium]|nr:LysR family transcriptional regulator [Clostridiales bacterium]